MLLWIFLGRYLGMGNGNGILMVAWILFLFWFWFHLTALVFSVYRGMYCIRELTQIKLMEFPKILSLSRGFSLALRVADGIRNIIVGKLIWKENRWESDSVQDRWMRVMYIEKNKTKSQNVGNQSIRRMNRSYFTSIALQMNILGCIVHFQAFTCAMPACSCMCLWRPLFVGHALATNGQRTKRDNTLRKTRLTAMKEAWLGFAALATAS